MPYRKIGPFLQKNYTKVSVYNAPMVKLVDPSVADIQTTRESCGPNTLIVVRFFYKYQPLSDPREEAYEWCARVAPYLTVGLDHNVVFEGYNEIGEHDTEKFAIYEQIRQDFLHKYGYGGVYGNHGVGNLNNDNARPYESLINSFSVNDFFGWHSYWGTQNTVLNPWHTARWTVVDMLKDVPGLITECGCDYVVDVNIPRQDWGARGWKLGGISVEQYLQEIEMFAEMIDFYPNIGGASLFLVGPSETKWDNYQSEYAYQKIKVTQTDPYFYRDEVVEPLPPVIPEPPEDVIDALLTEISTSLTSIQGDIGRVEDMVDVLRNQIYD